MNRYSTGIALFAVFVLGLFSYAEDITVELKPVRIEHPTTILTPRDFIQKEGCPVVTYSGLIIPENRLGFSATEKEKSFDLAGTKVTVVFDGKASFSLKAGGKEVPLERKGYGLATAEFDLGGRNYMLAFPRSVTYAGNGAVWYRSGSVMAGTLGEMDVCFYDVDTDGTYDIEKDVVKVAPPGKGDVFAPLAETIATKKGVFKIVSIAKDGLSAVFSPVAGDTVNVPMQFSTREKDYQCHGALASEDGKLTFAAISGQTLALPPGKYRMLYGFMYNTRTNKVEYLWAPHEETLREIKKDDRNPPVMPFGSRAKVDLAYEYRCEDGKIKLVIKSPIVLVGWMGEKYMGKAFGAEISVGRDKRGVGVGRLYDKGDGLPAEHMFNMPDLSKVQGTEKLTLRITATPAVLGWMSSHVDMASLEEFGDQVLAKLGKAEGKDRLAIIKTLGGLGGAKVLDALKKELASENADCKIAALQSLTAWPNAGDAEALLEIASTHRADEKLAGAAERLALNAVRTLTVSQPEKARDVLRDLSEKAKDGGVKKEAAAALAEMEKYIGFIVKWMLSGPYTEQGKDGMALFDVAFPPEKPDAKDVKWREVTGGAAGAPYMVDLNALKCGDNSATYLRVEVESPEDRDAVLELGSDDTVKAWLNGEQIHANKVARGVNPGEDKAKCKLKKGANTLVVKITNGSGGYGMCARFTNPKGAPLPDLKTTAK